MSSNGPTARRSRPGGSRGPAAPPPTPAGHLAGLRAALEAAWTVRGEGAPRRVLVLTHRGPDPDALGACEGMRLLCESFGFEAEVATVGRIHRAENLAMVRELGIELGDYQELDPSRFVGALLVDSQPEFGHTELPEEIPLVAIFDHHVPPAADADHARPARPEVAHVDVRLGTGATSTIVWEYLREAGVELDAHTASALFCGVRYDTADLSRNASPLDEEAYYACFRRADRAAIARIAHPPLPRGYYKELRRALGLARAHGPLVIALMGRIENPEFVAEMADFLLRRKGTSWVVVGGAYERSYVLSLRTDLTFGQAYALMARVLDGRGSFGGHGHIAGAQVPLEDGGESAVASVERVLRKNALSVLGSLPEGESIPLEGKPIV